MDQFHAALLTDYRDASDDLAFSALPDAPRKSDQPSPLRRSVSRGLVRAARRLEPEAVSSLGEPLPHRSA